MSIGQLYISSNNVIELQALTNVLTGAVDAGATVTVTLKDHAGNTVAGETWPKTMSLVTESPTTGTYRATLDYDLVITAGKRYKACISIVGTSSERDYREIPIMAQVRGAT